MLRPEAIEVVRGEGELSHWSATVVERIFLGEKIEYRLRCGNTSLNLVRYNAGPRDLIDEGAVVRLRVIAGAASLLPKGSA